MREGPTFAIIVVLIAAAMGTSSVMVNHPPRTSITQPASSLCGVPFKYDSDVLVATPGSIGQICVLYGNSLNNSVSIPTYTRVYEYNASGAYGVCKTCMFNVVTSLQDMASQSTVAFVPSANPSNEIANVTYTITIPSNVTRGTYGIFLLQFCSLFPVVVTPNGGRGVTIPKSDISSWYPHQGSCPAQVLGATVLGVSGFNVVPLS
jgi:hypothetical protein